MVFSWILLGLLEWWLLIIVAQILHFLIMGQVMWDSIKTSDFLMVFNWILVWLWLWWLLVIAAQILHSLIMGRNQVLWDCVKIGWFLNWSKRILCKVTWVFTA